MIRLVLLILLWAPLASAQSDVQAAAKAAAKAAGAPAAGDALTGQRHRTRNGDTNP